MIESSSLLESASVLQRLWWGDLRDKLRCNGIHSKYGVHPICIWRWLGTCSCSCTVWEWQCKELESGAQNCVKRGELTNEQRVRSWEATWGLKDFGYVLRAKYDIQNSDLDYIILIINLTKLHSLMQAIGRALYFVTRNSTAFWDAFDRQIRKNKIEWSIREE